MINPILFVLKQDVVILASILNFSVILRDTLIGLCQSVQSLIAGGITRPFVSSSFNKKASALWSVKPIAMQILTTSE